MPKIEAVDEPYPPYAALILIGKKLDPQKITDILKVNPHRSFKRGDKRRDKRTKWPHGLWRIDSSEQIQSIDLTLHIKWLLEQIEPTQTELAEILKDKSIDAEINCFWIMPSSHEALILDTELLKRISKLNIRLELSVYSPD